MKLEEIDWKIKYYHRESCKMVSLLYLTQMGLQIGEPQSIQSVHRWGCRGEAGSVGTGGLIDEDDIKHSSLRKWGTR